ncbi:phage tail tape measure protein [Maridesulfovibrio sp.]|uniref:phage tail tape measure protein n=1 Tax=Maridesulfovibrio sp. TaxID=2795000 RepID=UPI003AFFCA92
MAGRTLGISMEIGASLGSTFKSTFGGAESRVKELGSTIRKLKSEPTHKLMDSFYQLRDKVRASRKELQGAEKDLAELKDQAKAAGGAKGMLARRIEKAEGKVKSLRSSVAASSRQFIKHKLKVDETGEGLGKLSADYRHLSSEMGKAKSKMDGLNSSMDAGANMREQIGSAARMGAGIAAGAGAIGAAMTMVNKATGEQVALARSLGVSTEGLQAWGGVAKEAGYEIDNIGDLIEEMNNKLGESAGLEEITPVKESLQILGLSFEELQGLKPEEQFRRIAKAIKAMPDGQQASAAADILMGGEANKFFGYLRSRKEGVDQILAQQKRLNVLSKEGRAGAAAYNTAFSQLTTVIGSVTGEIFGLIGGAIAPLVNEYGPKMADWVRGHRQDFIGIGESIKSAIPAFMAFGRGVYTVFSTIGSVVSGTVGLLGGWENAAIALGVVMGGRAALGVARFANNAFTMGKTIAPLVSTHFPALATATKSIGSAATWTAAKTYVLGAAQKAWAVGQAIVTGACTAIGTAFRVMGTAIMSNPIGLAIGGIAIGATLLISNWGKVKEFFVGVWSSVVKSFTWAWDKIKGLPLIGLITEGASAIGNIVGSVGKAIGGIFGGDDEKSPQLGSAVDSSATTVNSYVLTEPDSKQPTDHDESGMFGSFGKAFGGLFGGEDRKTAQTGSAVENGFTSPITNSSFPESAPRREVQLERAVQTQKSVAQSFTFNNTVNVAPGVDASSVKSAVIEANNGLEGRIKQVVEQMFAEQRRLSFG